MFERMLAPLDGSLLAACVLPHLAAFANLSNAEIHLVRVLDRGTSSTGPVDPMDWHLHKEEALTYLREAADRLQKITRQHVQIELLEGNAAVCIVDYADRESIDLIVLSSHGEGGVSAWSTSSVAQKVIQRARCSVLLVRAYAEQGCAYMTSGAALYRRIMVPLDGSQRAETILPLASAVAHQHDAELFLVHVVRRPEFLERAPRTPQDEQFASQLLERNYGVATKYVEELQSRLLPKPQTHILIDSDVALALHEFTMQNAIDLVLTTAHGYSGRTRWPYGTIASSFIMYGTTPLLLLQDAPKQEMEVGLAERMCGAVDLQDRVRNLVETVPELMP